MLALLLWGALSLPQALASVGSAFTVSLTAQSLPAAVGTPRLLVDGKPRSILPAVVELNLAVGETRKVDIWGEASQHYSFSLMRSAAGVQLTQYVDSCQKERARPSIVVDSRSINIVMTFHIDVANCSSSPSTALPNARIKIHFQSKPQDTILYFDNSSASKSTTLPAVLSLGYSNGMRMVPFTVYFKKAGYFDCAKDFKL